MSPKQIAYQQRAELLAEERALLDRIEGEGRATSPEERAELAKLQARVDALDTQIEQLARVEQERIRTARPNRHWSESEQRSITEPPEDAPRSGILQRRSRDRSSSRFAQLFPSVELSMGGFRDEDDFWRGFLNRSHVHHPGLDYLAMQQSDVDSLGGVALPTEVEAAMLDAALEQSVVMSRANVVPMSSEKHRLWGFDGSTVAGGTLLGGLTSQWRAEGEQFSVQTVETKKVELVSKKLGVFGEITREASEMPGFGRSLQSSLASALAWFLDDTLLYGDGIAKPAGVLTSANPARLAISRAGSNAIVGSDIVDMVERLHPSMYAGAVWITSSSCLDELSSAHITGTNSDVFLYSPGRGEGLPSTLFGLPVILSEKSPDLGATGDLSLVNFSQYAVGLRAGARVDTSEHVGFLRDTTTIRVIWRGDGQSKWSSPYQPKDATSPTLSYCCVLAA